MQLLISKGGVDEALEMSSPFSLRLGGGLADCLLRVENALGKLEDEGNFLFQNISRTDPGQLA